MSTNQYQQMLIDNNKPKAKKKTLKPVIIPFAKYKEKSRDLDTMNAHVSMDGETGKVTVRFLK